MGTITNPNRVVRIAQLAQFKTKADALYQTQAIAVQNISATTVTGALAELRNAITNLGSVLSYKGSVADVAALALIDNHAVGDTYNVVAADPTTHTPAGTNYAWNGTAWDALGGTVDLTPYKTIDSLKSKGAANKGVYFDADGNAQPMTYELNCDVPANAVFTDDSVTAVGNHYAPAADNSAELTASLEGTADASVDDTDVAVVKGIKVQRDAKGHVVGITVTKANVKDTTYSNGNGINLANKVFSANVVAANGLSCDANGIAMAAVVASTSGAGGSNGAMTAAQAEQLATLVYAENSDVNEIFD